jgi:anionic cell wall polymer biosynthesis LytR-Cps2A-Psr (LCP) family protein
MQTLNGVQAVGYSRVRYTEGGDYRRTERMRAVIEAMFKKLKDKSIGEINSFADKVLPEVYTNLEPNEVLSLTPNMLSYKMSESIGWPYKTRGITTDRWYGVPVTLEENVKQLHKEIFGEEDYTVSEAVKDINDAIISKTGYSK